MIHQNQNLARDRSKLEKIGRKGYRDAYLQSQVRSWVAYQFQALREKFGLSQIEMAKRTGKTQSMISRLESEEYGRVSVQTLLDVACAMDVALIVQFVSYPDFLDRMRDKSEAAMQPQTISESLAQRELKGFALESHILNVRNQRFQADKLRPTSAANEFNPKQFSQIQPDHPSRRAGLSRIGAYR